MDEGRKIIHLLPGEPFGGLQVIVLRLARAQIRAGRDVTLLLTDRPDRLVKQAAASGIPTQLFAGGKIRRMIALCRWLARRRGAIVHSHCEPIWATLALAVLRWPRWIAHLHTYARPGDTVKERAIHHVHRRSVSRFIAITGSVAQSYLDRGLVRRGDLDVVHNGLDHAGLSRESERREDGDFTVCFAGRIVAEKGIMDFVALAARLRDEPGIRFVVAGAGPDLAEAQSRAATAGLGDRIAFLGFVADMSAVWPSVSLFTMLSEREPFGLVILEAIASGAAVLGYDTPSGGQEIMAQIPGCHMVPRGSIEDLAAALLRLKHDRAAAINEVEAGRRVVRDRFALDRMEADVGAIYGKLGAERPCASR